MAYLSDREVRRFTLDPTGVSFNDVKRIVKEGRLNNLMAFLGLFTQIVS